MGWWNKLVRDKKAQEQDPALEFWSVFDALNDPSLKELWPQPASQFFPEWFKNVPKNIDNDLGMPTIRKCPIFPEYMTQGYIIPMWCDFEIDIFEDGTFRYDSAVPTQEFGWEWHNPMQYLNWVPENEQDKWAISLKAVSPWMIKTPPGWSCYVHPPFYHFLDAQPLNGSVRTDISHELNVPLMIPKKYLGKKFYFRKGDPFVWIIPYKREKLELRKKEYDEETKRYQMAARYNIMSKFDGGYKAIGQKSDRELG